MKRYKKIFLFETIILLFLVFACVNTKYNGTRKQHNQAYLYRPDILTLHPKYFIYHNSDTLSMLFFKIHPNELAKRIDEKTNKQVFLIKFSYKLLNIEQNLSFVDSSSVVFKSFQTQNKNEYISYVPIKIDKGKRYVLDIKAKDMSNNKTVQSYINIDKRSLNSTQNFLITNSNNNRPAFVHYFNSKTSFFIANKRSLSNTLYVKYYSSNIPSPMPPYYIVQSKSLEIEPDSNWVFKSYKQMAFSLKYKGIYFFQTDTMGEDGIALFNFNEYFPEIKTAHELVEPLKYLTSYREFKAIKSYEKQKIAVDSFWLNTAGNADKARELIRIYYNRVKLANKYYTSYTEGYNTDRGMIYIVLGPPRRIFKTYDMEKWSYGQRTDNSMLEYVFYKIDNEFTNNYYLLERNDVYSQIWNQAVDTWRSGLVYSISE